MLDCTLAGQATGGLTILRCDEKHTATKHYTSLPDGGYRKELDYDTGFLFRAEPYVATDLADLAALFCKLRTSHRNFIVRGALDDAYFEAESRNPQYRIARRKNDKGDEFPPHLTECPRQWGMFDIDEYPLPPSADLVADPASAVDSCIRDLFPPAFHGSTAFWQLSASCGLIPGVLKVHITFWFAEPYDNAHLRRFIKTMAPHLDHAPFSANQPHYIGDPVIRDSHGHPAPDPLPQRTGWRHGNAHEVTLPRIPDQDRTAANRESRTGNAATPGLYAPSISAALEQLGDGQGRSGFHAPLLAASMQYALRCTKGGRRDDKQFMTGLAKAINAAPKRESRVDVDAYLEEAYQQRLIDGAFVLIENTRKHDGISHMNLPEGFGMTATGLFFTDPADDAAQSRWVCHPFNVLGRCSSHAGEQWGIVLSWKDDAGWPHTWICDRAMLHGEAQAIAALLEDRGLRCSFERVGQQALRRCLGLIRPELHLTAVDRGGWHDDSYVLPNGEVIGGADVLMRSEAARRDLASAQNGTLQDWQSNVGRYCPGNSRLVLFTSAAFAGPLLELIHEPSGGLHLYGGSQKGKTTAGLVAASVWGKGARGGKLQQWRSTANALERVAARSSDGLLVMDELSQSEAIEAGAIAYMLANEQGKSRMDRWTNEREALTWRLIFLSTGEVTLAERMMDAHKKPLTGMEVRLIDIPMDGGAGMGLFENIQDFKEPGAFADHLRDAAATYYGTAARAFLEWLVAERRTDADGLCETIRKLHHEFRSKHLPAGSDGQVRSVCGRFGIIAAAGELATQCGVLPWVKGEAEHGTSRCFHDWLKVRGHTGAGEEQKALAQVRSFFELHGSSRFPDVNSLASSYHAELGHSLRVGFRKMDTETKRWTFYVLPQAWREHVCAGLNADATAELLANNGCLERDGAHWAKKVSIPGIGRPRVYVISSKIFELD